MQTFVRCVFNAKREGVNDPGVDEKVQLKKKKKKVKRNGVPLTCYFQI